MRKILSVIFICLSFFGCGKIHQTEIIFNLDFEGYAFGDCDITYPNGGLSLRGGSDFNFHHGNDTTFVPKETICEVITFEEAIKSEKDAVKNAAQSVKVLSEEGGYYIRILGYMYVPSENTLFSIDSVFLNEISNEKLKEYEKINNEKYFECEKIREILKNDFKIEDASIIERCLLLSKKYSLDAVLKEIRYKNGHIDEDYVAFWYKNSKDYSESEIYLALNKLEIFDDISIAQCILEKRVKIGMSKYHVTSAWGKPRNINRTITSYGTSEQWCYNNGNYLYFDDGILTSIQTSY